MAICSSRIIFRAVAPPSRKYVPVTNLVTTPPRRKPPTGGGGNNNNDDNSSNSDDMFGYGQRMTLNRIFYSKMTPGYLNILVKQRFHRPVHISIITLGGFYHLRIEPCDDYTYEYEDATDYDIICEKLNYWGISNYVTDKIKGSALTWFTTFIDIPLHIPVDGERLEEFMPQKKCEDLEEM